MFTTYLYIITIYADMMCNIPMLYMLVWLTHLHNGKIIRVCLNVSLYFKLFLDFFYCLQKIYECVQTYPYIFQEYVGMFQHTRIMVKLYRYV